ncbi:hypothetical protein E3Q17_01426 [Wallemia mellicola]|uniref:Ribosomal protein S5 domain 2-like protein n=1 Tax=Wallemia mellicola TaxID=1708541 RepID=A0A4V4MMW5_9BASI|nr:hypothetical protein E3Q17_01426 [Wallemia mellicola]
MFKVGIQSISKSVQRTGCLKLQPAAIQQRFISSSSKRLLPRIGGGGFNNNPSARYTFEEAKSGFNTSPDAKSKYVTAALAVGGTILGTHFVLNRETREGGGGLATVTAFSVGLFRSNVTARLMSMNPSVAPDNKGGKTAFWFLFNAAQAATLSPLLYIAPPALMVRAGLYTAGVIGSLSYVGATSKNDTYLYLGGPLLAGCVVIAISSLIPMFRVGAGVANAASNVSLYGGLAVFGGFTLYDTQRILQKARMIEGGAPIPYDPLNESISLELNFINLFIRILTILMNQQVNALKENKRLDGRSLLEGRPIEIQFGKPLGSVTIKLGECSVMSSVSCTVTQPTPERPYEGQLNISSELSAMTTPFYEPGMRGNTAEEEATLNRQLDKAIRRSGMVDREALCIIGGEKVWSLNLTLHYISDDGNLIDTGVIAAAAALLHFRRPDATVIGNEVTYHSEDERVPVPLAINHTPISFSYVFFDDFDNAVLDPTALESQLSSATFTITTTPQKEVLTITKNGGTTFAPQTVLDCLGHATERAAVISKQLHTAINEDLDRRKIGGVL